MIHAALVQLEIGSRSKEESLACVLELTAQAGGADLILLPELWNVGYLNFDRYDAESELLTGPTMAALARRARELRAYILAGSIVERAGSRLYNASPLFGPTGGLITAYRKIHLFGYRSREKELLTAGDEVVVAQTELGTFGLSICYDLRFPELYRAQVERGAEALLVVAAWPPARIEHWRLLARGRAVENQAFLLGCNAAGPRYGGHSLIVSPQGEILREAGETEEVLEIELDLEEVARLRAEFPALADRSPLFR